MGLLPLSIGIGLVVSLMFTELFGLAAGGMVVPGYIALQLTNPIDVVMTLGLGFVTYAIVHSASSFMIIYGRRRTVLMILVGYLLGMVLRSYTISIPLGYEFEVIGFIIPGLIAIWLDRQGIVETICSLLTASAVVRLVLIITVGTELWVL
ncbi:MAG: poly-gamma-glutamate biosynthesis protein PgsC [Deltaproteobacteria bacterium]|nr:poly-gamma-glutamate biosynthesis protein PgsC [Deltaproteobacteria bacterium]MCB9478323.1 poly-gamma-glutamate biosynthesis protein PgsC [Deltaproteobacteria bacterium]MCB9489307.1 poly-gamma-glutamate biosynthesis protein PgsC [Deltaproteobacteria bacterium]